MTCPICEGKMTPSFSAQVLNRHEAHYEHCPACGFLRAHEPTWLEEAYVSAIAAADTGLVMRNISLACKLASVLYWVLGERGSGRYLDAAGGYGMLTRMMRDLGFDFYWMDQYCQNLLAPGFEYHKEIGDCRAVTAMEVMEHLTDPAAFVEEMLSISNAQVFLFTTVLYEGRPPHPNSWWYYSLGTGQHIGFFQRRTLETMAAKLGFSFASANGLHIFSKAAVNERWVRVVTARWASLIGAWWIRRRLGSKTIEDQQLMLNRIST